MDECQVARVVLITRSEAGAAGRLLSQQRRHRAKAAEAVLAAVRGSKGGAAGVGREPCGCRVRWLPTWRGRQASVGGGRAARRGSAGQHGSLGASGNARAPVEPKRGAVGHLPRLIVHQAPVHLRFPAIPVGGLSGVEHAGFAAPRTRTCPGPGPAAWDAPRVCPPAPCPRTRATRRTGCRRPFRLLSSPAFSGEARVAAARARRPEQGGRAPRPPCSDSRGASHARGCGGGLRAGAVGQRARCATAAARRSGSPLTVSRCRRRPGPPTRSRLTSPLVCACPHDAMSAWRPAPPALLCGRNPRQGLRLLAVWHEHPALRPFARQLTLRLLQLRARALDARLRGGVRGRPARREGRREQGWSTARSSRASVARASKAPRRYARWRRRPRDCWGGQCTATRCASGRAGARGAAARKRWRAGGRA